MEKVSYLEHEDEEGKVLILEIADKAAREEMSSMKTNVERMQEDVENCDICGIVTGSTVNITDSAEAPFEELAIYGESTQVQTAGKNLLPLPYAVSNSTIVLEGVTFNIKADGTVEVNGTSTGDAYINFYYNTDKMLIKEPFIFSKNEIDSTSLYYIERIDGKWSAAQMLPNGAKEMQITPSTNATGQIFRLTVQKGKTVNNLKIYPMIRLASITDGTYEPYTGGKAAPNPDYPQEIEPALVSSVDVVGKNLLKFSQGSTTSNGITFTVNADKSVTVNGTATADAVLLLTTSTRGEVDLKRLTGKNIILSGCPKGGSSTTYKLQFWSASKWAVDTGSGATLDLSTVPDTWNFAISIISGTTVNNLTFYPMIRLANTDDTYKPYQEQTVYLTNFYAMNGLNGVRDCIDAARGVHRERFEVVVLDGSDDEGWYTMDTNIAGVKRIYTRTFKVKNSTSIYVPAGNILCSHYKPISASDTYLRKQGIATTTADNYIYFYDENFNTADISLWKAHLKANPITLMYERETPKETALPAADIQALKALHTYSPSTTVNADAPMEVKYYRNTENGNVAGLLKEHTIDKNNPHNVTKEQLGLDKVNNTADKDKYVYHAQKADEASLAEDANNATNASKASLASKAMCDKDNNEISSTYMRKDYFKEMTGTLEAGKTSLTLSHEEFSQGCTVEVYVLNKGVYTNNLIKPTDMSVSMVIGGNESLDLEFESQSNDLDIKVRFW